MAKPKKKDGDEELSPSGEVELPKMERSSSPKIGHVASFGGVVHVLVDGKVVAIDTKK